jgi:hypothetical protein
MSTIPRSALRAFLLAALCAMLPAACSAHDDHVRLTAAPVTVDIGSVPQAGSGGRLVLHLDDVRVAEGQAAVFRVFVNRPDATAATATEEKGFVDEIFLVPARSTPTAPGARSPGQNLALPLSAGRVQPGEKITVTLIPVAADAAGQLTRQGSLDVTLKRPYVTLEH